MANNSIALKTSFDDLSGSGFVREAELIPTTVPLSFATLWCKCGRAEFPKTMKLSGLVAARRGSDVRARHEGKEAQ
jgi:hypothetical protein